MINRDQFIAYWNDMQDGLGQDDSILWTVENTFTQKSKWFINVKGVDLQKNRDGQLRELYHPWCTAYLQGHVICYSSAKDSGGKDCEWWGFEFEEDILMWVLKWA